MAQGRTQTISRFAPWLAAGGALFACHSLLAAIDGRFGYDVYVEDMPIAALVGLMAAAGVVYLFLPRLVRSSQGSAGPNPLLLLTWIVVAGLAMRLVFLGTQPILEDDYNRYLLDGAVTAHGLDPYDYSPLQIYDRKTGNETLDRIAATGGVVLERINYPKLTTVYPPVAQAAFALAHWIAPWSLDAWRLVLLACDLAVLALIFLTLRTFGVPPAWAVLYWWNPIVVKELHNSAHMDLLVMLGVAAALLLAVRTRPYLASVALAFGIGAKLWPVLLFPSLMRRWLSTPPILVTTVAITAGLSIALLAPILLSRLDETSGFVAYGSRWQSNDALFRAFEWIILQGVALVGGPVETGKLVARALAGVALCLFVLIINRTPPQTPRDTAYRVFVTIGALLLVSPTQFPWYFGWLAIMLPLFPMRGFLVLSATLPLYYAYFHFAARDQTDIFRYGVVLAIWLPAWVLLILDRFQAPHGPLSTDHATLEPGRAAEE